MAWEHNSIFQINATLVANEFIDRYMAGASGEYVKIYLYLLRHQDRQPDMAAIAEDLHYTEGDVKRAVAYWEKLGVLIRRQTEETKADEKKGELVRKEETLEDRAMEGGKEAIDRSSQVMDKEEAMSKDSQGPLPAGTGTGASSPPVPVHSQEQVSRLSDDEDFSQLLYIAQKYMNKVFTQRECQVFAYLYGGLALSAELLEYLVEYCVQNGHTSIRYMETVALNWHQRGLSTVEEAKAYCAGFSKDAFAVMKAFGLSDRRPAEAERRFIDGWFGACGFTREVVLEACDRTIRATHSPSFPYADKILREWKKAGVKSLSDVKDLDMLYQKQEKGQADKKGSAGQDEKGKGPAAGKGKKSGAVNRFHNFEQSATDYDSLMMEKIRAKMKK